MEMRRSFLEGASRKPGARQRYCGLWWKMYTGSNLRRLGKSGSYRRHRLLNFLGLVLQRLLLLERRQSSQRAVWRQVGQLLPHDLVPVLLHVVDDGLDSDLDAAGG